MAELLIYQTYAIVIGFIIDFFVGDPHAIPHPVVAIGKLISFLEKRLRLGNNDKRDILRGFWTVLIVIAVSTAIPSLILFVMWRIHPVAYLVVSSIMCAQIIAARELVRECARVRKALEKDDIEEARNSGEDLDNDYMRLWLTGKALNIPGLSVSDVVKKWEIVFNGRIN